MGIVQFVDLLAAVLLRADEAQVSKHSEVLRHCWLLQVGFGRELLDRARPLSQPAEELDPAAGCESVHRVGDEVRRVGIDGGQVDVVPLGDLTIIAQYMRFDACIVVRCVGKRNALRVGAWESNHEIWKTNPEVGASPRSLA